MAVNDMISMYKTAYEGRTYFIYWLPDPKIVGVCNGVSEVYELTVSEEERAQFVNVSETILPTIWRESMVKKSFIITSITPEAGCVISFGTKRTLALRSSQDLGRLALIMEELLKRIEALVVDQEKQKPQKWKKPAAEVPVKRRKAPVRGIQWDED